MELEIRDLQDDALPLELLRDSARRAARVAGIDPDHLSLVFVDDEQIREINRRFRNLDRPTDVIAFETEEDGDETVGEVIVSVPTARRQALGAGHSLEAELVWLIAHGVLHVAGMDDATQDGLDRMIAKQMEIAAHLGLQITP